MRTRSAAAFLAAAIAAAATCAAPPAMAQPAPAYDQLFQEGRKLLDAGDYDGACAKFEASLAKNPRAVGVLMNLARCNELRGRLSTALALFREATDRATEASLQGARDQASAAVTRLDALVPHLVLHRLAPPLAGQRILVDDVVIAAGLDDVPVDPGTHTLLVTAPGRVSFEAQVTARPRERTTVDVPALAEPPALSGTTPPPGPVPAESRRDPSHPGNPRRRAGTWLIVGGAVALATGGVTLLVARHSYNGAFDDPDGAGVQLAPCDRTGGVASCDPGGQQTTDDARRLGTIASVIGVVGVGVVATGLVLRVTATDHQTVSVTPVAGAGAAGLALSGHF